MLQGDLDMQLILFVVIFLLDLTLLGPFLGLDGTWLSQIFAYCSVSDKQKKQFRICADTNLSLIGYSQHFNWFL